MNIVNVTVGWKTAVSSGKWEKRIWPEDLYFSLIYNRKSTGPNIYPCGTLNVMFDIKELQFLIETYCFLLLKWDKPALRDTIIQELTHQYFYDGAIPVPNVIIAYECTAWYGSDLVPHVPIMPVTIYLLSNYSLSGRKGIALACQPRLLYQVFRFVVRIYTVQYVELRGHCPWGWKVRPVNWIYRLWRHSP